MVAISQQGTSVLFTSHPKDGLVVNLYRRMPLQAEEALGPISILRGSCGTVALYGLFINFFFLADHGIGLRSPRFLCRPTTLYIFARRQSAIYTENS